MVEVQDASTSGNYESLKDDPIALLQFVNKYCLVHLVKNTKFSGFLHSIDPTSKSIILAAHQENSFQIVLIPGHAVMDISETNQIFEGILPFQKLDCENLNIDIESRKAKVMEWLKTNLIPVTEANENICFGNVQILPPYKSTNICTDNPIVAMQVRKLIEQLPKDL